MDALAIPAALSAELVGRYVVEREVGSGGMASVYLEQDVRHDRRVALKVLRPELAASVGAERFFREIQVTARLTHPNILPLLDSGRADDFLYYVTPYVEGESLRHRLDREGQLSVAEAVRLAAAVAGALDYAHRHQMVHRDIKPENILLEEGQAVVADFGIARALHAAEGGNLTETGVTLGTAAYMSPEQATGDRLDGRSDVYSLGCVLYEMLAGEPPYTGPTAQAIIAKRFSEPIPHVRTLRDTVSEPVVQALQKALAKAPVDRFATAAQLASALAGVSVPGVTARPPLFTDIMTVLGELQGYPHSGVEKAAEALDASLDPWPWARTVFGMYAASRGRPNDVQRAVVSLQGLKAGSQKECATRLSRALGHFAAAKLADNALKAEALFRAADVAIGSSGCFSFDRLFLHDVVRYQALRASFAAGGLDPASRWLRGDGPFQ